MIGRPIVARTVGLVVSSNQHVKSRFRWPHVNGRVPLPTFIGQRHQRTGEIPLAAPAVIIHGSQTAGESVRIVAPGPNLTPFIHCSLPSLVINNCQLDHHHLYHHTQQDLGHVATQPTLANSVSTTGRPRQAIHSEAPFTGRPTGLPPGHPPPRPTITMSVEAATAQMANTTLTEPTASAEGASVGAGGDKPINASQNEAVIASAAEGRRLYIGNLAYATTEGELKEFFKDYLVYVQRPYT